MFGVGLRPKHYRAFLEGSPRVEFVEAISENFMGLGGRPLAVLDQVRRERPVFLHGVSLGIASAEPFDERYLTAWKALVERVQPALVSDHLCWGRAHGRYAHDLLPVPLTHEALAHVVERVGRVQDFLGRRLTLENVSSYLTFEQSELTEWDFLAEVSRRSGCGLLLDVNNVFVSSRNHGFDPDAYLEGLPREAVTQFHLAGHQLRPDIIIDTHDGPVSDEVWSLYARAVARFGAVPTLIEWDDRVPELDVLLQEAERARARAREVAAAPRGASVARVEDVPRVTDSLAKTQAVLFEAICAPVPISEEAARLVRPHGSLDGKARLELYADMYWLRLRDTLRELFPATVTLVGVEHFDGLVADFLKGHGSTHFSLDRVAEAFAGSLEGPVAALAALEHARTEAFVAPDAEVVAFEALQRVPPDAWAGLSLVAHPSVRLLELAADPTVTLRDGSPPAETACTVMVWRNGLEAFHARVSTEEFEAARALMRGAGLPEVMEPFAALDDAATHALTALSSWFHEGMISRVASAPPRDDERKR